MVAGLRGRLMAKATLCAARGCVGAAISSVQLTGSFECWGLLRSVTFRDASDRIVLEVQERLSGSAREVYHSVMQRLG